VQSTYARGKISPSNVSSTFRPATKEEIEGLYPLAPEEGEFIRRYKKTKVLSEEAFINLVSSAVIQQRIS